MAEVTLLACAPHTRGSPATSRRHSARTASAVVTVLIGFQAGLGGTWVRGRDEEFASKWDANLQEWVANSR